VDLDGDGQRDVLSGSWPGEIYWFRGKAEGGFATSDTLKRHGTNLNVGRASALAAADWDVDGDIDLLIGTIDGWVTLLENQGTKTKYVFTKSEKLKAGGTQLKVAGGDAGPCVADWDGDGKLDLVLGSGEGSVTWCRNAGNGKLEAPATLIAVASREKLKSSFDNPTGIGTRTKVCVADWNGDGKQDLVVGDFHSGGSRKYHGWVWVYLRNGASTTATAK
jgi:hypothetical protein